MSQKLTKVSENVRKELALFLKNKQRVAGL